jgi:multicomponent Na+:H+ antiporter subunit D
MNSAIPILLILSSLAPALVIFGLREEQVGLRTALNMGGASLKLILVGVVAIGHYSGESYESRLPFSLGWDLVLRVDDISFLFMALSATLWFLTTLYAIGYLENAPNKSRFFGFFSLCVSTTMGISMAGNLFTFFIFYEMLTLTTYPLVVHRGTEASLRAGRTYLLYTLGGGAILLLAVVWIHGIAGPVEFQHGGVLERFGPLFPGTLRLIFFLLIAGLGVKSALVPLHVWLPQAMIAPAPVSALLHAVAVVKAGAFGIIRTVYDIYGIEFAHHLGLLNFLAGAAALTIIYGSLQALRQTDIKRRLAYSTVSQVSYILLGVAVFGPSATLGGLVHLVHQGLMKITLFFCAGNLAETLGIHSIDELKGVGRRMPLTMGAFTLSAVGMIGLPPMAGFVSKWYLGLGAIEAGELWILPLLLVTSLLNAAYFLPLIYRAWFQEGPNRTLPAPALFRETPLLLLLPTLATALLALLSGLLAGLPMSPLGSARGIVEGMYGP